DADHPGFFSGRRRKQRVEQGTAVATASTPQLKASEPKLVASVERAEKPEADRLHAAVLVLGPEHVAWNRNRFDAPGARVFLDEIAAHERAFQPREELDRSRRIGREPAIEAPLRRGFADQGTQHR